MVLTYHQEAKIIQGPQEFDGRDGSPGAPGAPGAPGIAGIEKIQLTEDASVQSNGIFTRQYVPDAGYRYLSFGFEVRDKDAEILYTMPFLVGLMPIMGLSLFPFIIPQCLPRELILPLYVLRFNMLLVLTRHKNKRPTNHRIFKLIYLKEQTETIEIIHELSLSSIQETI